MPSEGDTSPFNNTPVLDIHDLEFKRDTGTYNEKGGAPFHLLKEQECKLVINLALINKKGERMSHFVALDGKVITDFPEKVMVNKSTNRATQ